MEAPFEVNDGEIFISTRLHANRSPTGKILGRRHGICISLVFGRVQPENTNCESLLPHVRALCTTAETNKE